MFGFQACVLCLTALALVDFIFVSFRSSLTVDRNGILTMLTIMIIHELIVFVQMGLVMRLVMLTYWFEAGLFCACAKVLTVVAPVWVLRLFFTCFPCVYRIYFVPGHSANQVCDAAQKCVLRSTRRPWHDGGYGALVVLDLIVALVNALAVLHLLSFLSEKSLYPPYDHVLRTTREWKSLDPTDLWTASGDTQESIETAPMASSAPDTSARPPRGSSSSVVAPNVAAMAPGVSQSTALTASTDAHVHDTRISWQRRATEELSARNAWRAMFLSDMLEPERPTLTEAEQPPSRRDHTDHDENRHVPVALDTDTPDVRQESTSVFRPNHEERLCVPLSSRSSDDGSADNNADRSHRSDSTVQRASAHTRGPSLGRPESERRVSSPFTPTPAPSLSRTPPSTTRTRLGPVASTAAPTNSVESTSPSTANTPSWEAETRGNPFFTYDVSGYRSSGHPHRRQSSHVMSALLPASSEHMTGTGTGPTTMRTRTSSSSATSGAAWLRQAGSLDSGVGARPFLPAPDVNEAQHTRRTGQGGSGDGEKGLGLKRFFAFHRHSRRRSSSAANPTVSRSDQHAVATSHTRTAPPSPSNALAFAFPASLSYQQQQQTQMQPQHGRQAENADPGRVSRSPSERPGTARPRAVSSTASGAAANELRVPGRGGEAEMMSSRKDHSSLLFHDDPFMLELHSGVVSAMRDGAQASSTASFLHTIGASAGTTRTAPSASLLSRREAAGQQLVRSTTIPPSESGDDVGKEVEFPRTTMPPLPRPPPSS